MSITDVVNNDPLYQPLTLPCGVVLPNRIVKSAMSDSLGDGCGNPTEDQICLYERWASNGVAVSLVGEVQGDCEAAEKPGNLVLRVDSDQSLFKALAKRGSVNGAQLWLQLGHAGAMAHRPIGKPRGPSAIDVEGLNCKAMSLAQIQSLPDEFARTASLAQSAGFGGVQIHAAHGFLLSQFLSPLFNKRTDGYGGSLQSRMRLLLEVLDKVSEVVDAEFVVAVKLNATDQLEGGFEETEALEVIKALNNTRVDLVEISGGTYFPGAKSASDCASTGPYFVDFASAAAKLTSIPLMATGGFKTQQQAREAVTKYGVSLVGLARALVIEPDLVNNWRSKTSLDPQFPRFPPPPPGGITAWYTMQLTRLAQGLEIDDILDLDASVREYDERDARRVILWNEYFKRKI